MPVVKTVSHPLDRLDFCRRHFAAESGAGFYNPAPLSSAPY
jgi:hypothetical protein